MTIPFEQKIEVRWQDCDLNRHVRHSAYYDYGAHARIRFFMQFGYDSSRFKELGIGPVLFKEECTFLRELKLEETITINIKRGELKKDGSRWILHHEIFNGFGTKSAHLTVKGAWMDIQKRKLSIPPIDMAEHLWSLPEGEAYVYGKT